MTYITLTKLFLTTYLAGRSPAWSISIPLPLSIYHNLHPSLCLLSLSIWLTLRDGGQEDIISCIKHLYSHQIYNSRIIKIQEIYLMKKSMWNL